MSPCLNGWSLELDQDSDQRRRYVVWRQAAPMAVTGQQENEAAFLAIYDVAILRRKANNLGM